jgi:hypothetical protein
MEVPGLCKGKAWGTVAYVGRLLTEVTMAAPQRIRSYPLPGVTPYYNDDVPSLLLGLDIPDGVDHLLQRVPVIDDRSIFPRLDALLVDVSLVYAAKFRTI